MITGITPFARTGEVSLFVRRPVVDNAGRYGRIIQFPKFLRRRSAEMIIFFGKMERFSASEYRMLEFLRIMFDLNGRWGSYVVTHAIFFSSFFLFWWINFFLFFAALFFFF